MKDDVCSKLVQCLVAPDTPRVWSLLVTVFGDLAQAKGAKLHGRTLSMIFDAIGIKPEALRVALHRLRKDGWIESERVGRQSLHGLSDKGLTQSAAATPRIYGACPQAGSAWVSVFDRSVAGVRDSLDGVWIDQGLLVSGAPQESRLVFSAQVNEEQPLPRWMKHKLCPDALITQATTLSGRLAACEALVANCPDFTRLQSTVLRILVVHEWRRLVLKVPELPDHVFPEEWAGPACRARVHALLAAFPRVDPAGVAAD